MQIISLAFYVSWILLGVVSILGLGGPNKRKAVTARYLQALHQSPRFRLQYISQSERFASHQYVPNIYPQMPRGDCLDISQVNHHLWILILAETQLIEFVGMYLFGYKAIQDSLITREVTSSSSPTSCNSLRSNPSSPSTKSYCCTRAQFNSL